MQLLASGGEGSISSVESSLPVSLPDVTERLRLPLVAVEGRASAHVRLSDEEAKAVQASADNSRLLGEVVAVGEEDVTIRLLQLQQLLSLSAAALEGWLRAGVAEFDIADERPSRVAVAPALHHARLVPRRSGSGRVLLPPLVSTAAQRAIPSAAEAQHASPGLLLASRPGLLSLVSTVRVVRPSPSSGSAGGVRGRSLVDCQPAVASSSKLEPGAPWEARPHEAEEWQQEGEGRREDEDLLVLDDGEEEKGAEAVPMRVESVEDEPAASAPQSEPLVQPAQQLAGGLVAALGQQKQAGLGAGRKERQQRERVKAAIMVELQRLRVENAKFRNENGRLRAQLRTAGRADSRQPVGLVACLHESMAAKDRELAVLREEVRRLKQAAETRSATSNVQQLAVAEEEEEEERTVRLADRSEEPGLVVWEVDGSVVACSAEGLEPFEALVRKRLEDELDEVEQEEEEAAGDIDFLRRVLQQQEENVGRLRDRAKQAEEEARRVMLERDERERALVCRLLEIKADKAQQQQKTQLGAELARARRGREVSELGQAD